MTKLTQNLPIHIRCLVVLVGPPGSGKSTWATKNGGGAIHVSQDGLIDAITPNGFDHLYRAIYAGAEDAIAHAAIQAGHTVIVDRTNRTRSHRERWLRIARQETCPAIAVVMTTSEDICRTRNSQRVGSRRLSDERVERMFGAAEAVSPDEGFFSIHFEDGVGKGIRLADILPGKGKEQLIHEHCNQTR